MPIRSCRVTIESSDGLEHAVHVSASSLYEAVALGIAAFREDEWVGGIPEGLNPVRVSVTSVAVEHTVTMQDFKAWLTSEGRSPREKTARLRVREILGILAEK